MQNASPIKGKRWMFRVSGRGQAKSCRPSTVSAVRVAQSSVVCVWIDDVGHFICVNGKCDAALESVTGLAVDRRGNFLCFPQIGGGIKGHIHGVAIAVGLIDAL